MTVDHILFNKQNWYSIAENTDNVTASEKKYYAVPSKITIKQGTSLTYPSRGTVKPFFTITLEEDAEVECIAANDKYYFFTGYVESPVFSFSENTNVGVVLKSNCKNIVWGGKALLSHLYQWFRNLYRMVVIAC